MIFIMEVLTCKNEGGPGLHQQHDILCLVNQRGHKLKQGNEPDC